jgi:hypothetical protein
VLRQKWVKAFRLVVYENFWYINFVQHRFQ